MPIEIRELVIRATTEGTALPAPPPATALSDAERQELVEACVRQVLAVLAAQKER